MVEWYLNAEDQEKKKKKRLEAVRKKQTKEAEIQSHLKKNKLSLSELQDLVKEGVISFEDKQTLEKISQDQKIDEKEMDDIVDNVEIKWLLEQIEEIEKSLEDNDLIPKELKISKQDFLSAVKDPVKRQEVLQKIDDSIDIVVSNIGWPTFKTGGNPFARRVRNLTNLLFLTNKKTIDIQEHMIDLKNYLRYKTKK